MYNVKNIEIGIIYYHLQQSSTNVNYVEFRFYI